MDLSWAATLLLSSAKSRPICLTIWRLSSVKSFRRTAHGVDNPAECRSFRGESPGQGRLDEVIMAIRLWPCRLKLFGLTTRAGRLLYAALSVNGNGTATTSQASQVTERFLVFR